MLHVICLRVQPKIFFNLEQLLVVGKIIKISDINYYWISEEEDKIINKRFLRQDLYAKNDQFS